MENSSDILLLLYHSMVRVTYLASYLNYSDEVWFREMMQLIVMVMLMI
jgi:hypothetical protein